MLANILGIYLSFPRTRNKIEIKKNTRGRKGLIECLYINSFKPFLNSRPQHYISIPFQIQLQYQSSFPILLNMMDDTLKAATPSSLSFRLSMLHLNLKPLLDIEDFEDPSHLV